MLRNFGFGAIAFDINPAEFIDIFDSFDFFDFYAFSVIGRRFGAHVVVGVNEFIGAVVLSAIAGALVAFVFLRWCRF